MKRPGGDDDQITDNTDNTKRVKGVRYIVSDGLRKVIPYFYVHTTGVKERWIGKTILEVYEKEFASMSREYYRNAITNGKICVNDKPVSVSFLLRKGQRITHKQHVHEPPVLAQPIEIVLETADLLVVNKPASIPVHPTGVYRENTVTSILEHEKGLSNLHPVHRIDRLTSGLLIIAKSKEEARKWDTLLRERVLSKEYYCRVLGKFPPGTTQCEEPIGVSSHREGVNCCAPDGQPASTTFELVKHEENTSIVKALPHSGRQHQIRCHLQFLGFPIANDPIYASSELTKIKRAQTDESPQYGVPPVTSPYVTNPQPFRENCAECGCEVVLFDTQNFELWLHARAMSGKNADGSEFRFEVPLPTWMLQAPPTAALTHKTNSADKTTS